MPNEELKYRNKQSPRDGVGVTLRVENEDKRRSVIKF